MGNLFRYTFFAAVGTGISDACPQLSGQLQCCSADYFRNAGNQLLELTLPKGFFKQCQSRLDLFGLVTKGIVDCKSLKWREVRHK